MADARTLTPRTFSRNMYIPENNPEFMAAQERKENSYERFKRETIENTYNYVLQQTGSPEKAQDAAQSVARKMFRTEAIASVALPEAAIAGVPRAVNLARSVLGGERAGAASQSPALLTGPRNAILPEEMLSTAPAAPAGQARLTSGEFLPRIDIPRVQSSGITARDVVSSPFDDLGRMVGEGGLSDDAIAAAQQMARDRVAREEAFRARQLAEMEGEGGSAVGEILRQRQLRAAEDAALTARQMGTAEGEGMLTADAVQAARAMVQRRLEAEEARRAAEIARFSDEGGGMAMTRPMERGALPAGSPPSSNYPVPALRGSTEPSVMPSSGGGGGYGGGTGGGYSAPNPSFDIGGPRMSASRSAPSGGRTFSPEELAKIKRDLILSAGMLTAGTAGLGYGFGSLHNRDQSQPGGGSVALGFAPSAPNMRPMDSTLFGEDVGSRPAPMRAVDSTIFGETPAARVSRAPTAAASAARREEPAASPASLALWNAYNRSMMEEGGGRADLFERARRAEMEEGRARGGAAKGGGKDAAMHKALEIIHHMLVNR